MKKSFILLFFVTTITGFSQGSGIRFIFQAGLSTHQNLKFDPVWGVASIQMSLHLNDFIFLAPECIFWAPDLKFKPFHWSPGVTANYSFGDIFLGGGLCRLIRTADEKEIALSRWLVKAQLGYLGSSLAVNLFCFMDPDLLFRDMRVGFLIGIVI